ncbi:hypothetical protein CLOM_g23324, partial [Closterium sp. NIES-68]
QAQAEIEAQIEAQLGSRAAVGKLQQPAVRSPQGSKPDLPASEDGSAAAAGKKGWGPLTFLSLVSPHLPHHHHQHAADPTRCPPSLCPPPWMPPSCRANTPASSPDTRRSAHQEPRDEWLIRSRGVLGVVHQQHHLSHSVFCLGLCTN